MKTFFRMVKFELIRVSRNKIILTLLLTFSILLLFALSFIQSDAKSCTIAIYTDGLDIEQCQVLEVIEKNIQVKNSVIVDTNEDGVALLKRGEVCFFISLTAGETNEDTTAVFYYDQTNTVGRIIKDTVLDANNEYAYITITNFLDDYGITLNEKYFQVVTFKPASDKVVEENQLQFALEVGVCISIVLMFGLAYSMSRDNETNVSRNLSYMPIGVNRYLLSKAVPYYLLGILQLICLYVFGALVFKIQFEINICLTFLLSIIFVIAVVSLSQIFNMLKSQIATIFLDMITMLLPLFSLMTIYLQATPIVVQVLLNCFPIVPFVSLLNGMMFNGVILWGQIGILTLHAIIYYLIAMFILKKRINA